MFPSAVRSCRQLCFFLLLIPLLTTCARPKPVVLLSQARPDTLLMIDTHQITVLPSHFFGYGTEVPSLPLSYANRRFISAMKTLRPGVVNFPGNQVANEWEYLSGLIQDEWVSQLPKQNLGTSSSKIAPLRTSLQQTAALNLIKGGTSLSTFLDSIRSLDIDPICTANILHQKPEETAQWQKTTKALGRPVHQWKLGQDLWKPEYRTQMPSPEAYMTSARAHAKALRAADPNVRVCAEIPTEALFLEDPKPQTDQTTQSLVYTKTYTKNGKKHSSRIIQVTSVPKTEENTDTQTLETTFLRSWVTQLSQQNFYDAVALDLDFALRSAPETTPEYMHYAISRQAHERIEKILDKYVELFRNKEIWVNEWNVNLEETPQFSGSLLQALSLADISIALANRAPQVRHICYSDFNSAIGLSNSNEIRAKMVAQFKKNGKIVNASKTKPQFENITPSVHALRLLGEFFAFTDRKAALVLSQPPLLTPKNTTVDSKQQAGKKSDLPPAITAMALLAPDNLLRIAAINHSSEKQALRLVVNNRGMAGPVHARILSGKDLLPKKIAADEKKSDKTKANEKQDAVPLAPRNVEMQANHMELPAYSFSIIEMQM